MLTKLKILKNKLGVLTTVLYILSRFLEKWVPKSRLFYYLIVVQPVPDRPLLSARRGQQFSFRVLKQSDELLEQLPRPRHVIEARFKQGSICIAATLKGQLVGCIWLQFSPYREDEVRSIFTPSAADLAWDYDVYVCESQRHGFLFAKLWDYTNEYFRSNDISFTASRISGFNTQSINSHQRLGARTVKNIIYLIFGRIQITFCGTPPWCHLSVADDGAPVINVNAPENTHA
jgi:hypothetical protein